MQGREAKDRLYEQFSRTAKALASPRRIEVLELLAQGERTVEALAAAAGMGVTNTSAHLQVLRLIRPFDHFLISGSEQGRSREFAQEMARELGAKVESVYSRACAAESDVLCTCTTSKVPLFDGHLLRPGTHLNLIGAFQPHTREVDDATVQRSRIVVDTYEGALVEAGDLIIPLKSHVIERTHILSDLHQLVTRKRIVRTSPDDITLFKSVGCALEDLVTAELVALPAN